VRQSAPRRYYEEVGVIPTASRSDSGPLIGVGPQLYAYFRRIGYTSVFIGYLADAALGARNLHLTSRGSCASDGVLGPTGPGSPASRVGGGVCAHHHAPPTCSMNGSSCGYTLRPLAGSYICQAAIFSW
jgi:hypothetical protein